MKAVTVKNRSIQDGQLNTGTLAVKEMLGEGIMMKTIEQRGLHEGVAVPPPTYQTNTSTWAAFGGSRSSYTQGKFSSTTRSTTLD